LNGNLLLQFVKNVVLACVCAVVYRQFTLRNMADGTYIFIQNKLHNVVKHSDHSSI